MGNQNVLRRHWGAVLLALIMSLFFMEPFVAVPFRLGMSWRGIMPEVSADDYFYSARIQDVLNGHPFIGNPYLYEHRDAPPQQVFLAEWILAQPLRLFGARAVDARAAYGFILPGVCFLLGYAVLWRVGKSRLWALVFASFYFFYLQPFKFLRPVSPQFNFIFWLTLFLVLWKIVEEGSSRKLLILGGLNIGFLFYIYPYYWAYYGILLALLCVIYFFTKRSLVLPLMSMGCIGLFVGSWYFYYTYEASRLPWYEESLLRLGMVYSHFPSGVLTLAACVPVLVVFAFLLKTKAMKWTHETVFIAASMVAVIAAVNVHVITGKNIHFAAHYYPLAYFIACIGAVYAIPSIRRLGEAVPHIKYFFGNRVRRATAFLSVVIVIVLGISASAHYLTQYWQLAGSSGVAYMQQYAPVFDWLNRHADPESVVYANAELSNLIPLYTHQNVFFARFSHYFLISDEEVLRRFAVQNYFTQIDEAWLRKYSRDFYGARYVSAYRHAEQGNIIRAFLGGDTVEADHLPPTEQKRVEDVLAATRAKQFEDAVKQFRIDYILWDKEKNPEWNIEGQQFLERVFESGSLVLYRVK